MYIYVYIYIPQLVRVWYILPTSISQNILSKTSQNKTPQNIQYCISSPAQPNQTFRTFFTALNYINQSINHNPKLTYPLP